MFVVDRGPWYSWAFRELGLEYYHETFGDRSGVERSFGSLKRRAGCYSAAIMNMFFAHYNVPRLQEGMGRAPSEVIAVLG